MSEEITITQMKELENLLKGSQKVTAVIFVGDWSEYSIKALEDLKEMVKDSEMPKENVVLAKIDAEGNPEISQAYNITGVPTILLFQGSKEVQRVTGVRIRDLITKLSFYAFSEAEAPVESRGPTLAATTATTGAKATKEKTPTSLKERIEKLINQADVMLFMKGTPDSPKCGFSRKIVEVLNETEVPYSTFDILTDNEIREGLKDYSNWRTYPQLYRRKLFVGGLDIVEEFQKAGVLITILTEGKRT